MHALYIFQVLSVKTAIYDLCSQRPPGLYDRNSVHTDDFVRLCGERLYLWNVTSDHQILHAQSQLHVHVPGVWDHSRVHMYLRLV